MDENITDANSIETQAGEECQVLFTKRVLDLGSGEASRLADSFIEAFTNKKADDGLFERAKIMQASQELNSEVEPDNNFVDALNHGIYYFQREMLARMVNYAYLIRAFDDPSVKGGRNLVEFRDCQFQMMKAIDYATQYLVPNLHPNGTQEAIERITTLPDGTEVRWPETKLSVMLPEFAISQVVVREVDGVKKGESRIVPSNKGLDEVYGVVNETIRKYNRDLAMTGEATRDSIIIPRDPNSPIDHFVGVAIFTTHGQRNSHSLDEAMQDANDTIDDETN